MYTVLTGFSYVLFFNCYLFQLLFMLSFSVWLGFQSGSEYMLQSLYLMCKEKHHKSQKHSSVFSNGSLNHSEDEKAADTSLFGWVQNRSYLALDSSDFWLIYQAASSAPRLWVREIFSCSQPLYNVCLCQKPHAWLHVQTTLYPVCLHGKHIYWCAVMTQGFATSTHLKVSVLKLWRKHAIKVR